jgi:hypothetical protein
MQTETGRYKLVDTLYPSKSPGQAYLTLFNATTAAILRNIATGHPHRYVVRQHIEHVDALDTFRMMGAL